MSTDQSSNPENPEFAARSGEGNEDSMVGKQEESKAKFSYQEIFADKEKAQRQIDVKLPFLPARKAEAAKADDKPLKIFANKNQEASQKAADSEALTPPKEAPLQTKQAADSLTELQVDNIYPGQAHKADLRKEQETEDDPKEMSHKSAFAGIERDRIHDLGSQSGALINKDRLRVCILNLAHGRIIVVGDLLIDELLEGNPERISREAPVLILEHVDTELIPGGAANTANNIVALGGQCHALGVAGTDDYATKLEHLLDRHNIKHSVVRDPQRPTTVKTRILSKSHSFKQQLIRLDRISHNQIDNITQTLLLRKLEPLIKDFQAIVLSDYRAGVMSPNLISNCRRLAKDNGLILVADAQEGFERFQNVDLMTPNQPDAEAAVGYAFNDESQLLQGGKDLLTLTGSKAILVTRGAHGMSLFRKGLPPHHLPVFNRSEVFDVTGAGDTVVATLALAMVTGATLEEATALGNLAAGIVVRKPGTAVISQKEMLETLEKL
jgi:rfaE bifunctional protein kinase chain/domain